MGVAVAQEQKLETQTPRPFTSLRARRAPLGNHPFGAPRQRELNSKRRGGYVTAVRQSRRRRRCLLRLHISCTVRDDLESVASTVQAVADLARMQDNRIFRGNPRGPIKHGHLPKLQYSE